MKKIIYLYSKLQWVQKKKFFFRFKRGLFILFLFLFLIKGRVFAFGKDKFLQRPLSVELIDNNQILVADGGGENWSNNGSKILMINRKNQVKVVYDQGLIFAHDAQLINPSKVLIADTTNNRVIIVDLNSSKIVFNTKNFPKLKLSYPNSAKLTDQGTYLITDRNNDRFIEIDNQGKILFEYKDLLKPHGAEKLKDGHYLVSDSDKNRVLEIDESGKTIWSYGTGDKSILNWPRDFDKLANGDYLITDSRNQRVIEVSPDKKIVWEYKKNLFWPYEADRLENGDTLISDSQQKRIIEVDNKGKISHIFEKRSKRNYSQTLLNGGFEDKTLKGWIKGVLLAEGKAKLKLDKDSHSGNFSGRVENNSAGPAFWFTKIKINKSGSYLFTGYIKSNNKTEGGRYEFIWENNLGGFLKEPVFSQSVVGNQWKKVRVELKVPQGAKFLNIRATVNKKGVAWFDDLKLKKMGVLQSTHSLYLFIGAVIGGLIVLVTWKKPKK